MPSGWGLVASVLAAVVATGCGGSSALPASGCPLPVVRADGQLVSCCGPGISCNGMCPGGQCWCPDYGVAAGGCPVDSVCCADGCHPFVQGFACPSPFGGAGGGTAGAGGAGGNGGGAGASGLDGGDCSPPSMFGSYVSCCVGAPCNGECHDGQCVCSLGGGAYTRGCSGALVCCQAFGCLPVGPQNYCPAGPA